MRRLQTNLPNAARAKALHDAGIKMDDIVEATGIPQRTIYNIVNMKGPWADIVQNERLFNEYRVEVKKQLQTGSLEIAKGALHQIERRLPEASAAQASVIYGIVGDKERMDSGEAVMNIAIVHKDEVADREQLLERVAGLLANKDEATGVG